MGDGCPARQRHVTSRIATKNTEERKGIYSGPLDGAGEPGEDASCEQPRPVPRIRADCKGAAIVTGEEGAQVIPALARSAQVIPFLELCEQSRLGCLLVLHDAQESGQGEHGEESVEDGRAAHDDCHAVRRQEKARQECECR